MGSPTQSPVPLSPPTKQKPKVADRIVSRASNAWILYRSDAIARIRAAEPEQLQQHSQADLSKLIAARWRTESVETKRLYELKAKQRKQDHVGSPGMFVVFSCCPLSFGSIFLLLLSRPLSH